MVNKKKEIERLDRFAGWMDDRFSIPGTSIRFGVDSILGLIPGVGDTVTVLSSVYIIGKAQSHNAPLHLTLRMAWNAFLDWLIGLIPFVGDIFDIGWKSNRKNIELLKKHVGYTDEQ